MRLTLRNFLIVLIVISALFILIYTRFINLEWGLPYSFHPDERNMAWAIMRLTPVDSYNPHFFAYGQLPLYASYLLVQLFHAFTKVTETEISYTEAVMGLRAISAVVSVLTVVFCMKIVFLLSAKRQPFIDFFAFLLLTFSPVLIQFAHYGTTEALLMFFFVWLLYYSLLRMKDGISARWYYILSAVICGMSVATKVSSLVYVFLPCLLLLTEIRRTEGKMEVLRAFFRGVKFIAATAYISFLFSPYNLIDFKGFLGSMHYESDVALGKALVFYTRAFDSTTPLLFQFIHIFPFVLGFGVLLCFILGFIFLPYTKTNVFLRLAFLSVFLPNAFMYTKWTRFLAPAYPVMILIAILLFYELYTYITRVKTVWASILKIDLAVLLFVMIMPGIAFLSIYQYPDVRYTASHWIHENLEANSKILSETANVVDMPIFPADEMVIFKPYEYISFDSYNVDADSVLQERLTEHLATADYIFVPSRRVFKNHTCLSPDGNDIKRNTSLIDNIKTSIYTWESKAKCKYLAKQYPILNEYYTKLFNGTLGYHKVAEFNSFPRITLFGITIAEYPDEDAEETWSVFDHPVVRIYKRNI